MHTVIAQHASVKLKHLAASRRLMQTVDILSNHRPALSVALKLREREMGFVRLRALIQHFVPVKTVKFLRSSDKKTMAQDSFRRIVVFLIVKTVNTSEIRNAALRTYSRPSEKNNIFTLRDPFF